MFINGIIALLHNLSFQSFHPAVGSYDAPERVGDQEPRGNSFRNNFEDLSRNGNKNERLNNWNII